MKAVSWETKSTIARIESPWVTVIAENVLDEENNTLEYWRVEKPDSLIVLPVCQGRILLPKTTYYRHGAGQYTHDFPGGRLESQESLEDTAYRLLEKELGYEQHDVHKLERLNKGWLINSAFSNQCLFGIVAELTHIKENVVAYDKGNASSLRDKLICLQCRALLLEYLMTCAHVQQ